MVVRFTPRYLFANHLGRPVFLAQAEGGATAAAADAAADSSSVTPIAAVPAGEYAPLHCPRPQGKGGKG
eukprot:SAG22_NODE_15723_length_342_cov_0.851852_1_plen_68_part_10